MINSRRHFLLTSTAAMAVASTNKLAFPDDWPQWRGVERDGVWNEDGIVEQLPTPSIPINWTKPIGAGYSGPTIAQGRVFVTDRVANPEQIERIHCFDANNGASLWSITYDCPYTIQYAAGPRASVAIEGETAYALGAMGHLHAVSVKDGTIVWKRDLEKELPIKMPIWGISASPIIEDGLIISQVGGADGACILALDTTTGEERWRALNEDAQYSAPILITQAGRKVIVVWTGESISGIDLATGKIHWRIPFKVTRMPIGVATPVVNGNRIFVTSFYDGSMMVKFSPDELSATLLWHVIGKDEQHTEALHSIISTPVFVGDYIYGVDSYGQLRCLDANNGARVWEDLTVTPQDRWSTVHFVQNGKRFWLLNEAGELIIANLSPQGYTEISRSFLIKPTLDQLSRRGNKGVCWSHPAFANRHVYARNDEELLCASLAAEQK